MVGEKGSKDAETRYLEFNFHRVRRDGAITHVLVAVADVTARVALAAQLKGAQDSAQTQMDAFLSILHVDPNQLSSFLDDSDVAFKMINATLRDPARDSATFRRKIDGLFRQIHSIKGEASAIGLGSMEARAHGSRTISPRCVSAPISPATTSCRCSPSSTTSYRTRSRCATWSPSSPASATASATAEHARPLRRGRPRAPATAPRVRPELTEEAVAAEATLQRSAREGFVASAQQLADRIANDHGKKVVVTCRGHDQVPEAYRRPVKDVLIQLIRNAVVHGIETPAERQSPGKSPEGHIRIKFEMTDGGRAFRMHVRGRRPRPDARQAAQDGGGQGHHFAGTMRPRCPTRKR